MEEVTNVTKRRVTEDGRRDYKDDIKTCFIILSEFSGLGTEQRGSNPCTFCRTPLTDFQQRSFKLSNAELDK